eukprot:Partr_v1_DN23704_c0_g2_i1_m53009 putative specific peptidase
MRNHLKKCILASKITSFPVGESPTSCKALHTPPNNLNVAKSNMLASSNSPSDKPMEVASFPELTRDCLNVVKDVLERQSGTITSRFNIDIKDYDIHRLRDGNWLNDNLVNFYHNLIRERSQLNDNPIHLFNTFFYTNIKDIGYEKVQRWTAKLDLFSFDLGIFPVHLGM